MFLSILLISLLNQPTSAYLDKLSPKMLNNLRACLLNKSQQPDILCDNRIHSFLTAASDSIQEIYSLYEPEAKAKTSTSKFPGVQSGFLQLVASTMADTSKHPTGLCTALRREKEKVVGALIQMMVVNLYKLVQLFHLCFMPLGLWEILKKIIE